MFILSGIIIGEFLVCTIFPGGMFIGEGMIIILSELFLGVCLFQGVLLFGTSEYNSPKFKTKNKHTLIL